MYKKIGKQLACGKVYVLFGILISIVAILLPHSLHGQQIAPLGKWTSYVSHNDVKEITSRGNVLYAITPGGFISHDLSTGETRAYTPVEGLSTVNPSALYYAPESDLIFIGFPNGLINYFNDPDDLGFITDINRSELFTTKTIHEFLEHDGYLYIATDFGLVVYDISRKETRYSVTKVGANNSGTPVREVEILNDSIFISVGEFGLYVASLNSPNLTVPTEWKPRSGMNGLPAGRIDYICRTDTILYTLVGDTVFRKYPSTPWYHSPFPDTTGVDYVYLNSNENKVFAVHKRSYESTIEFLPPDSIRVWFTSTGTISCGWIMNNIPYVGDAFAGLLTCPGFEKLGPAGPANNYVSEIAIGEREFYVAPRGRKGPSDRHNDKSGIYYFSLEKGWDNLNHFLNGGLSINSIYQDFARVYYDRATQTAYVGSWGDGIVVVHKGDTVESYSAANCDISTSSIDGSVRVSGLDMDRSGNLWVCMILSDPRLNAREPDGTWHAFGGPNNEMNSTNPVGLLVDDYGNKWIINNQAGLIVFNENGTLEISGDDEVRFLRAGAGNGGLPNNSVYSIAKDLDGQIWVGTSEGASVFYDPGSVFNSNFQDASCPIIDGFCLLRDQKVNTIAVDGANRKWMGTDNGIYLISADGTEQVAHFTVDNSPIFDNAIIDIAIDPSTGEVLIGTQSGMLSFMGDATEGQETSDSLEVFPNPVAVDYNGSVTIRGSVAESRVKITSASGMLVRELDSMGGEATWDLKDTWGNTVKPGIYLALIADKEGQGPGITKIAVIERVQLR